MTTDGKPPVIKEETIVETEHSFPIVSNLIGIVSFFTIGIGWVGWDTTKKNIHPKDGNSTVVRVAPPVIPLPPITTNYTPSPTSPNLSSPIDDTIVVILKYPFVKIRNGWTRFVNYLKTGYPTLN